MMSNEPPGSFEIVCVDQVCPHDIVLFKVKHCNTASMAPLPPFTDLIKWRNDWLPGIVLKVIERRDYILNDNDTSIGECIFVRLLILDKVRWFNVSNIYLRGITRDSET